MKINTQQPKTYGNSEGSLEKEVHSNTVLHTKDLKKTKQTSNKKPNHAYKRISGTKTSKA